MLLLCLFDLPLFTDVLLYCCIVFLLGFRLSFFVMSYFKFARRLKNSDVSRAKNLLTVL